MKYCVARVVDPSGGFPCGDYYPQYEVRVAYEDGFDSEENIFESRQEAEQECQARNERSSRSWQIYMNKRR